MKGGARENLVGDGNLWKEEQEGINIKYLIFI
jgi:hypothetical protein